MLLMLSYTPYWDHIHS